ncbi:MAG: tRNA 2-thiouridine(34) synthase MnmA [Candidatus Eisenbacteria bacterium]|nr:tRNA 2-thiouridine(34) synthase MnmA [Candidatus Eisenbacteria bacterium]
MTKLRVLAAMSGGVDSAVAAALLAEQGHEVTGVTLRLACYGSTPASPRACCTLDALDDARRTAMAMGFPHHVIDAEEVFRHRVLQPFADGYASGRTPYPCALCNQHLKFGDLVTRMELTGADVLATGHYAQVREAAPGEFGLYRAADRAKDQTYALALVPYAALARVRLPLGPLEKSEVRAHAQRLGLSVWDKVESQDLCFVPDGDYAGYLERAMGETRGTRPGAFLDATGARVGTHRGLIHYTVGQRRGLGLSAAEPLYVLALDPAANTVTVGPRAQLDAAGLVTGRVHWLLPAPPADGARALVRIRYSHAGAMATLHARGDGVLVRFDAPQAAVTPGQLAVFYDGERCLGGAEILHGVAGAGAAPTTGRAGAPAA